MPASTIVLCLLLSSALLSPVVSEPGWNRWDHHPTRRSYIRPKTTTTPSTTTTPAAPRRSHGPRRWDHRIGWSVPPERCQIPADLRHGGKQLDNYYIDYVSDLLVQDKTLLSPIVFDGVMVSRTNTYKNLYFVSFKVFRVLKGHIEQQFHGHLRLLFSSGNKEKPPQTQGDT